MLYFATSFIVTFISRFLPDDYYNYFSSLVGLFPLSGIVVMIVGRVKYPNNTLLKVAMWLIIASIMLFAVWFILFTLWCRIVCYGVDFSGCS